MERFEEKELTKTYTGKIENFSYLRDGFVGFSIYRKEGLKETEEDIILTPELQEKLDIKNSLMNGMYISVTTDAEGNVIRIEKILQ